MASQLKYARTITDKFSVNGYLSENASEITYLDADKVERTISVKDCINMFAGNDISLTLSIKRDEELSLDVDEEE